MNENSSLNEKDLKHVSGGTTRQDDNGSIPNPAPGIKCPNCGSFVPISIAVLEIAKVAFCPVCGQRIEIK